MDLIHWLAHAVYDNALDIRAYVLNAKPRLKLHTPRPIHIRA